MSDNGGIYLRGKVLDVEHKSGVTTKGQPYAFDIISVLTGKTVSEVRIGQQDGRPVVPVPAEGAEVNIEIQLDVYNGRQQIEARRVMPTVAASRAV